MRHFLIFLIFASQCYLTQSQSLEGIWMGKYRYTTYGHEDTSSISIERQSYLFDFYSASEFLIYNSFGDHPAFKYEKVAAGKFKATKPEQNTVSFYLEVLDEERLKLYPATIHENEINQTIFLDRLNAQTPNLGYDSLKTLLKSSYWSLTKDYAEFTFEFIDLQKKQAIISTNYGNIQKTSFGLIAYKNNYFFVFMDDFYGEIMIQLNEYDGGNFISFAHNMETFEDSKNPSTIVLKKNEFSTKEDYDRRFNTIVGKWKADVTDWKYYHPGIDDSSPIKYDKLAEWLEVDSVIYNHYQLEFYPDATYQFINKGKIIDKSKTIIMQDTLSGNWTLSPTLKYMEIAIDDPGYLDYDGRFVEIYSMDKQKAKFSLDAEYPSLFMVSVSSAFEFVKITSDTD